LHAKRYSLAGIGEMFHRPKSAIWYELQKKRKGRTYDAEYARHITRLRARKDRRVGKKIVMDPDLKKFVDKHLWDDQSPEAISKRLKRIERQLPYVSGSAVRRYLATNYAVRIAHRRNKIFAKKRRTATRRKQIEGKRMISKRPSKIGKKWGLGHMEGDFIVSGKSGTGMVFGLRDRKTRKCLLEKIFPVSVKAVDRALGRMKQRYPEMQTVTFDNDILFFEHQRLEKKYGITIYFCFPHSPWQKPSVENLNKFLRHYIPKGSDISKYSRTFIKNLEAKLNRKFMDCLGSLTPDEAYDKEKKQKQRREARRKIRSKRSN
jgi:IS30 family transposase